MLEDLKTEILKANLLLPKYHLVTFTWGNVSGIDRDKNLVVIKPSGVDYEEMTIEDLVVVDLDGNIVEGNKQPSTDTPTHLYLYQQFPELKGITHTHSVYATSWAQSGKDIPILGTTHADTFYGDIPCTKPINPEKIKNNYEWETGILIAETLKTRNLTPEKMPAVLCANHGTFTFGKTGIESVKNAKILEIVAQMALNTYAINQDENRVNQELTNKHYERKHGLNAYYGQKKQKNLKNTS